MFAISEVRTDLANILPTGSLCNQVWGEWKDAVGIGHYARNCTYEQWLGLCAAAALKRMRRKINPYTIKHFLNVNGSDPMAFLPGFVSTATLKTLPGTCSGKEIPDLVEEKTGYRPAENTVKRWVEAIGASYSRNAVYSGSQLQSIIKHYVRLRVEASDRAKQRSAQTRWRSQAA